MTLYEFKELIGFQRQKNSHKDNVVSVVGGFLGILGIFVTSYWLIDPQFTIYVVPSMGASAVLLFAAPHAPLSQPWNVLGGHVISAVVGVACWQWIPDLSLAASAGVGLAIGAMYLTRCTHPPGGATALTAVIGSDQLHQLGFSYVYEPILVNAVILLLIAFVFNGFFKWRRYPAFLHTREKVSEPTAQGYGAINHEDFVYALSQIDTYVDISEEDLLEIYQLATKRHVKPPVGD